jgi:heptaprenyl diphosphate synthase
MLSILGRNPLARKIAKDTLLVETELETLARKADDPQLTKVLLHLFSSGGKRLRPALLLLAAQWGTYQRERAVRMAAAMEMIHAASLVHDDIIDQATTRRGRSTANELWGTKLAVLSGDYLFAAAARTVASVDNVAIMDATARTIMALCAGEISQSARTYQWHVKRQQYYDYISQKTASLTALCCTVGATVSNATPNEIALLTQIGSKLGMAFQIVDDVLDFTADERALGKPIGLDIAQGMMTLPIIQLLERPEGQALNGHLVDGRAASTETVRSMVSAIRQSGVIDDSYVVAQKFLREAQDLIRQLGENDATALLLQLTNYAVNRTN